MRIKRYWINQPSKLQDHNNMHGTNVLGFEESKNVTRIFFLSGDVVSQQIQSVCLSPDWINYKGRG